MERAIDGTRCLYHVPVRAVCPKKEIVTLLVFAGFPVVYLKEPMTLKEPRTWNYAVGFAPVAAGAYFIFRGPLRCSMLSVHSSRSAATIFAII